MNPEQAKNIIFEKVDSLPTLPAVINRLIALMRNENVDINELVNVISYDMAISTRLLKVANSAYYGFMKKIATVRHAITVLGFREVKSLALGIAVFDAAKNLGKQSTIDHKDLWLHSIGSAMAARFLCRSIRTVDAEIAFTASMLHDIGKLILSGLFSPEYAEVIQQSCDGTEAFEAEANIFGFTHGEAGGWICEFWKLPPQLTYPIMHHHHIERAGNEYTNMAAIIQCADFICKCCGIGYGSKGPVKLTNGLEAAPEETEGDSLEAILEKKRSGGQQESEAEAVSLPPAVIEILALEEEDVSRVFKELGREKEKAQSFVTAIS